MQEYLEQNLAGEPSVRNSLLYSLCWAAVVVSLLLALSCAAGMFVDGEGLAVNWPRVAGFLAGLGLAWFVYRRKDRLRREYDYILQGGILEICVIYNARRRRLCARIPLENVDRFGRAEGADYRAAQGQPGLKAHAWHVRKAGLYYLCYMEESQRHMALLELSDEMVAGICQSRQLRRDAWRGGEGSYQ